MPALRADTFGPRARREARRVHGARGERHELDRAADDQRDLVPRAAAFDDPRDRRLGERPREVAPRDEHALRERELAAEERGADVHARRDDDAALADAKDGRAERAERDAAQRAEPEPVQRHAGERDSEEAERRPPAAAVEHAPAEQRDDEVRHREQREHRAVAGRVHQPARHEVGLHGDCAALKKCPPNGTNTSTNKMMKRLRSGAAWGEHARAL